MGTTSALPGFNAPSVGFEQPFAMLEACHERVQRTLALLQRLRAHVLEHGADVPAQQAARDVLRYFDIAAPLHHEDEELHVFPLLLVQGSPDVAALVRRLQDDHACMAADWADARKALQALVDSDLKGFSDADGAAFDQFTARYDRHIADEETVAYPSAQALLAAPALQAMGNEMAARRKAPPPVRQ